MNNTIKRAAAALESFTTVAENWVDGEGWTELACKNDRIVDWFGPSDFRMAKEAFSELQALLRQRPEPVAWMRDVDGSGRPHPALEGDDGAFPVYRSSDDETLSKRISELQADLARARADYGVELHRARNAELRLTHVRQAVRHHNAASPVAGSDATMPKDRVCIPDPNNPDARILGFRIHEGDEAWGKHGLSEPLFWLERILGTSGEASARSEKQEQAAMRIMPYLRWTIGDESPGHHPTLPSAVGAFAAAFGWGTEEQYRQALRRSSSSFSSDDHQSASAFGSNANPAHISNSEMRTVKVDDLIAWRDEWLETNDPLDGTDCVTPFDAYFYGSSSHATDLQSCVVSKGLVDLALDAWDAEYDRQPPLAKDRITCMQRAMEVAETYFARRSARQLVTSDMIEDALLAYWPEDWPHNLTNHAIIRSYMRRAITAALGSSQGRENQHPIPAANGLEMKTALEPFAILFDRVLDEPEEFPDHDTVFKSKAGRSVTYGDFRRARRAFNGSELDG